MNNTKELTPQITQFLSLLKENDISDFITENNLQDLMILKRQLAMFEFGIKEITNISDTDFYKITYTAKDNNQQKEHPSHWFALKHKEQETTLISRFKYLEVLAKQEKWRSIAKNNITFYFDYNIKDDTDIDSALEQMQKILNLFKLDTNKSLNYFICETKDSLNALGFTHTASDKDNIISFIPNDTFEMIKMAASRINEDASEFLRDGFALYYSKYMAKGNDTFEFTASDIAPMAREIIFNAPYANIKKCTRNDAYEKIINTLFFFSRVHAGDDPEIDYDLIILSPAASFITFLIKENTLTEITEDIAQKHIIELLGLKTYKEIKKEFKKHFGYSLSKYNRHWKKYLKGK